MVSQMQPTGWDLGKLQTSNPKLHPSPLPPAPRYDESISLQVPATCASSDVPLSLAGQFTKAFSVAVFLPAVSCHAPSPRQGTVSIADIRAHTWLHVHLPAWRSSTCQHWAGGK